MKRVLLTGAAGFVGAALAQRLLADASFWGAEGGELVLSDMRFDSPVPASSGGVRVHAAAGDISDWGYLDALLEGGYDVVFHLASVPGGLAEHEPVLGTAVNLHAATRLLLNLADSGRLRGKPAVVVFTSTVAVYGAPLPTQVDALTPLRPITSYGAHKVMTEYLLNDLSRRGWIDGRAVRLPGIVARPPQAGGHVSAFMSNIFHALAAGQEFESPVSAEAMCWWMSSERCVDNLLHLARMAPPSGAGRVWTMPVLRHSMAEVVQALGRRFGAEREGLVRWKPIPEVEAAFGRQPPINTDEAWALGLRDDGDLDALVERTLRSSQIV